MNVGCKLGSYGSVKKPCYMPLYTDDYGAQYELSKNKLWDPLSSIIAPILESRGVCETPKRTVEGSFLNSYVRDFYYRIKVSPSEFNVGDVVGDVELEFFIFNAFFEPRTLTHAEFYGMEGIEIKIDTPKTLSPLGEYHYKIKVTTDGPPTINAAIKLCFDIASENKVVRITGSRSVVIPFMSLVGQSERLEWLTAIGKSRDGTEERTSLRKTPRWRMSCNFDLPDRGDRRLAENIGLGWVKRQYSVPFWHKSTRGVTPLRVGDTTVMCDTDNCDFKQNDTLVLWSTSNDYENVEVLEVMPDRVVIKKPVVNNRDHYMVVPVFTAMSPGGVKISGTSAGGEMSATFDFSHIAKYHNPGVYEQHKGYAVMPFRAYGDEPRDNIKTRVDTFDNKVGAVLFEAPEIRPTLDRPFKLFADNRSEYAALLKWLSYCSGQYTPFLYDTNMNDLDLISSGLLSTTLQIRGDRFTGMSSRFRDMLVVEKKDNTRVFVNVIGSADRGDGVELLVIDVDLKFDASEVRRVSFLMCGRFASDAFTIRTLGRNRYSVDVTFKEI